MSIKESLVRRYVEQGGTDLTTMHSTSQLVKEVRDDEGDVPSGGTTGQVLTKTSDLPNAYDWDDASGGGGGVMIITPTLDYSNKDNQKTYYYLSNVNYEFNELYQAFLDGTPIFLKLPLNASAQPEFAMLPLCDISVVNNTPHALYFRTEAPNIDEKNFYWGNNYVTGSTTIYTATYSNLYGLTQAFKYNNVQYSVPEASSVYQLLVDGSEDWQESPSGTLTISQYGVGGESGRPFDCNSKLIFGRYANQEYGQYSYASVETNCEVYTCVSVKYFENYNEEESYVEDRDITATFRTLAMSGNTPMIKTLTVYASENEIVIQNNWENVQVTYSETMLETGK